MTIYAAPHTAGAPLAHKPRYDNFIDGQFVAPVEGRYFDVLTPISGKAYTQVARSGAADIERALDAAHAAAARWAAPAAACPPPAAQRPLAAPPSKNSVWHLPQKRQSY
jgi:aldehyde dehydrogenase